MSIIKRNYELSIWSLEGLTEQKIAIIGTPSIANEVRAQDISIKRNINGTKTLTFSLYVNYFDNEDGIEKENPFYKLLTNNTRLKLYWKKRWYEFLIRTIVEDSENKKILYTAEDAFITELSKRGFDIELSTELENNQKTLIDFGTTILKNSGWTVNKKESVVKPQFLKDVLVELIVTKKITATQKITINSDETIKIEKEKFSIPINAKILGFYSSLTNEDPFFQFYYLKDGNYEFDDDGLIKNCPLYNVDNHKFTDKIPSNTEKNKITSYQGKKLVRAQESSFDNILQTYVKYYSLKNEDSLIAGYQETEYLTNDTVTNLVTNNTEFSTDIGWYTMQEDDPIEVLSYPDANTALKSMAKGEQVYSTSYIKTHFTSFDSWSFYNSGFNDNKMFLNGLYEGQKFVVKIKFGYLPSENLTSFPKEPKYDKKTKIPYSGFRIGLCSYLYNDDGEIIIDKEFFSTTLQGKGENVFTKDEDYYTAICTNEYNYSKNDLDIEQLGIFFGIEKTKNSTITEDNLATYSFFIEDCQIFEYKQNNQGKYYTPEDVVEGEVRTLYNYFLVDQNYKTKEDIVYIYRGYEEQNFNKIYYDDYRQIRTVEAKESNYFNLIQTLCETFESWADFYVPHDSLGYIKKDSKGNFIKQIIFKPYIGKENWAGFHQGINLKKLSRTLESSQITTKTIVKSNNNEFAPDGFCTIAYSSENPSGESFIYDFSYYEQNNIIKTDTLVKDLYGKNGLYTKIKPLNEQIKKNSEEEAGMTLELIHLNSDLQIKRAANSELATEIATLKKDFRNYSGISYNNFLVLSLSAQQEYLELTGVSETVMAIINNTSKLSSIQNELAQVENNYDNLKEKLDNLKLQNKKLLKEKEELILTFENKYSFYIHEGVWISEEHTDPNIYYVDAKNIAATSAKPQVTYSIEVIDISSLEEFSNYDFDIGDKTYVTDTEFFGYIYKNGLMTPRQQEVVITEIEEFLDNPDKNKITVQNYKTQFEDLFQRITATSQQLQLKEGEYARAAGAFTSTGLSQQITQDSLNATDGFYLKNNSIVWDVDGLISTNLTNKREYLKIHNGSLFLTNDGGSTWSSAINGKGINANYIYSGQIDAGKINIVSELKKGENDKLEYALSLDSDGLTMYSYNGSKTPRVRLGKIITNANAQTEELYGLQLYNNKGEQTFKTDSDGNITMTGTINAKNGVFNGVIIANEGQIGGWNIDKNSLVHKSNEAIDAIISTANLSSAYRVNSYSTDAWRLIFGINGVSGNFGVTSKGALYAYGVDIKDGNISFGDIFKITSNSDGEDGETLGYGLNITLNPENEGEEVVIESDDRVIGIREWKKDDNGNKIYNEDGTPQFAWKTIVGDLSKVTLGNQTLSQLNMGGYGICTENGLFSGAIVSGAGQIGGFVIAEKAIYGISSWSNEDVIENVQEETDETEEVDLSKVEGIYLSSDGRFKLGTGSNYILFDHSLVDGTPRLVISAEEINMVTKGATEVSSLSEKLSEQDEAIKASVEEARNPRKGFSFNNKGLTIFNQKDEDNPYYYEIGDLKTLITENGMQVLKALKKNTADSDIESNWEVTLRADSDGVEARNLSASTFLIINGRSRFENYTRNNKARTACYWLGGD